MIVITGAAGFIGSCLVTALNKIGRKDLVLVDDFTRNDKHQNLAGKFFFAKVDRNIFFQWLKVAKINIDIIYHLGARTDTTESDKALLQTLNIAYSKKIFRTCIEHDAQMVYASSAATYGLGELGYKDDLQTLPKLQPLNLYGWSKQDFDNWVLSQRKRPNNWSGLKFFNVFGPNEYHKGRMASVIFHAFNQIGQHGRLKLFRSHNAAFADGMQQRDFIYVKDLIEMLLHFLNNDVENGIYNAGSGKANTFLTLGESVFKALGKEVQIDFIDTPIDIRDKYQYFTEADMDNSASAGIPQAKYSFPDAITDYVTHYLASGKRY